MRQEQENNDTGRRTHREKEDKREETGTQATRTKRKANVCGRNIQHLERDTSMEMQYKKVILLTFLSMTGLFITGQTPFPPSYGTGFKILYFHTRIIPSVFCNCLRYDLWFCCMVQRPVQVKPKVPQLVSQARLPLEGININLIATTTVDVIV